MMFPPLVTIAFSMAMIIWLSQGDPKRRRTARVPGNGHSRMLRRLLVIAILLPGLYLALRGDAAAFLMWLGSCAVGGWLVTLWVWRKHVE